MKKMEQVSKKPSVQKRIEQLGSLAGFILYFLLTILNFLQVKYWLGRKTELKKKLCAVFSIIYEFAEVRWF